MLRVGVRLFVGATVMTLLLAVVGQGARAATSNAAGFVAQARSVGLSAEQATALQAKVDDYLVTLQGRGKQVSPNQIDLNGAMLNVTVPGESKPRQLVPATGEQLSVAMCVNGAPYKWFCAYKIEYFSGDWIAMYHCDVFPIPWVTVGSWDNNQTPGTRPLLTFTSGQTWWMPAAHSYQRTGVDWRPVRTIKPC